ncbi:MAG: dephospho-CoA kinase [Gammaproteobacteria bacterium]|nr:dephospho-CoA kinase [Gammaproteobacteria bacterium]
MLIVGLTGGIGSGKTTVSRYFEQQGAPVIDADVIVHQLLEPGQPALAEIAAHFGPKFLRADGSVDRDKMREQIFSDDTQRQKLEAILHPRAREELLRQIQQLDADYCIASVPLLIESGWSGLVHRILVVDLPRELQIQRTLERDPLTVQQIEAVLNTQVDRQTRLAVADDIITNTGNKASLKKQVAQLHRDYLQLASTPPNALHNKKPPA